MKKLGPIILGFIIGALLTYYFCPRPIDDIPTMAEEIVKPKGVISVAKAKELNNNWTQFRKAAVDSASSREGRPVDNRYTSWSIKDIRDYLNYADQEAGNMGYTLDSVRVYLGVYGKKASREKADLTTMFMAPIGSKKVSKANFSPSSTALSIQTPTIPPLNEGTGGPDPYVD